MEKVIIYHNPRCSKSREALNLLSEEHIDVEVREYLKDVPTKEELTLLIQKLGIQPLDLIRTNEQLFKEEFKGQEKKADEWIEIMVKHPVLIERPIVVKGNKAIIGRPPVLVRELLTSD